MWPTTPCSKSDAHCKDTWYIIYLYIVEVGDGAGRISSHYWCLTNRHYRDVCMKSQEKNQMLWKSYGLSSKEVDHSSNPISSCKNLKHIDIRHPAQFLVAAEVLELKRPLVYTSCSLTVPGCCCPAECIELLSRGAQTLARHLEDQYSQAAQYTCRRSLSTYSSSRLITLKSVDGA